MAALNELRDRLRPHWVAYSATKRYPHLAGWRPEADDAPDMIIAPDKSVLLEVKAFEITVCREQKFKAGITLRFPRVANVRADKPWHECETYAHAMEMFQSKGGLAKAAGSTQPLAADVDNLADAASTSALPPAAKRARGAAAGLPSAFLPTDVTRVVASSAALAGVVVCVLTDGPRHRKADVERAVHAGGGTCVQNAGRSVTHYVAESRVPAHVSNLIAAWQAQTLRAEAAAAAAAAVASSKAGSKRKPAAASAAAATESAQRDIWLPQWIFDSVAKAEQRPVSPECVFRCGALAFSSRTML